MAIVNSVLGPIRTEDMGYTLMHEHLLVLDWTMRLSFDDWFNVDEVFQINCNEVKAATDVGVKTIVDGTAVNMGRDPDLMKRVSETMGVHMIASTGFYHQNEFWQMNKNPDNIARLIVRDIEHGMNGTDIKAGIIKCGIDADGLSPQIQMVLKAVAKAHVETGAPIYCHTVPDEDKGLKIMEFLLDRGVDPKKLVIGHRADNWKDPYAKELSDCRTIMDRGCYLGLDRLGDPDLNPLPRRVKNAVELIEKGYLNQMIFSHDFTGYCDWLSFDWKEMKDFPVEKQQLGMYQKFSMGFVSQVFVPELLKNGITMDQIQTILVDNPRRIFE